MVWVVEEEGINTSIQTGRNCDVIWSKIRALDVSRSHTGGGGYPALLFRDVQQTIRHSYRLVANICTAQ
jgi:hypothetical protein